MDPQDRIQIGVVGKPHGIRGGFYLDGAIDAPALVPGLALGIGEREFTVASCAGTDKRPIVILKEIADRDSIAELRKQPVSARRGDLTPLAEGEWFADDLVGLSVLDRSGAQIGRVVRLTNLPSVDVLEVEREDGELLMVPMISDAVVSIDPAEGGVVVDEVFLDLG